MKIPDIDIVVPVWNRPAETRSCLVALVENSPGARFILVDNSSDRETEQLLEEFAEALDEQALLLRTETNKGFIKALNWGLSKTDAPFVAIVKSGTLVPTGWLDPLLDFAATKPEAGILIPEFVNTKSKSAAKHGANGFVTCEAPHGSFAAMIIRRELHRVAGGFHDEMDSGIWCQKEFARRALKAGFLVYQVNGKTVQFNDDIQFGSVTRRQETIQKAVAEYNATWGEERQFCIYFPKNAATPLVQERFAKILQGARQGHTFTVLTHGKLYRELMREGYETLHSAINLVGLPILFPEKKARQIIEKLLASSTHCRAVTGFDGIPFIDNNDYVSFSELEAFINQRQMEKYN